MLKKFITLAFALALLGQVSSAQPGSTGLSFLKVGVGGRALAMGEAYAALATDPTATYYNPAMLTRSPLSQLLLMHKEWIEDSKTEFLGATTSFGDVSLGVGVNATSVSDIEIRSVPGPPIGTFTSRNTSIGLSAAYSLDSNFSIGATGKFIYERILADAASGFAVDLGGLYNTPWNVRLALVISNLGSINELDQQASQLPTMIRAGGAYEMPIESFGGALTFSSDIVSLSNENKTHLHFGSELDYKHLFMIRAGYQTDYEGKNFSAGVGIHYSSVYVDYAFVPFKFDLGSTHTFSLRVEFPSSPGTQ
jgi:hypothetical protein